MFQFANISGNTLLSGGHGVQWMDWCTNAVVLKNNFAGATHRALAYDGTNGSVRNIRVLKNVLNQGASYHLKLRYPDSGDYYLWKNTYTNNVTTVDPFLDAAGSPVHIIR